MKDPGTCSGSNEVYLQPGYQKFFHSASRLVLVEEPLWPRLMLGEAEMTDEDGLWVPTWQAQKPGGSTPSFCLCFVEYFAPRGQDNILFKPFRFLRRVCLVHR